MDEQYEVLGRGITNSRSNYDTATRVARHEALINTRFTLFHRALAGLPELGGQLDRFLGALERNFRLEQYLDQLSDLENTCMESVQGERFRGREAAVCEALAAVFARLRAEAPPLFAPDAQRRSDFFRDIAGSRFMAVSLEIAGLAGLSYDLLLNVYDKAIIKVENRPPSGEMDDKFLKALDRVAVAAPEFSGLVGQIDDLVRHTLEIPLEETWLVGTGYGRVTLPFSKEHIRSEILCHGLGAHMMYPETRSVLDIGGQDTKAIQIDP